MIADEDFILEADLAAFNFLGDNKRGHDLGKFRWIGTNVGTLFRQHLSGVVIHENIRFGIQIRWQWHQIGLCCRTQAKNRQAAKYSVSPRQTHAPSDTLLIKLIVTIEQSTRTVKSRLAE